MAIILGTKALAVTEITKVALMAIMVMNQVTQVLDTVMGGTTMELQQGL